VNLLLRYTRPLFAGVILLSSGLTGQDYLWPTNAGQKLPATFGDTRPGRYHAGVDISTNGGSGYELYAVEDGYIERILVSTQGYGKAIYLRLKDRRIAVYGHLQKFNLKLERRVIALQEEQGKYALDLRFNRTEYPVRRGDVIGYTGDTGTISGPHLHFEIRDPANLPLNPLVHGFILEDDIRPEISQLAIIPLGRETIAHGSILPSVLQAKQIRPGRYIIPDTIAVRGPFGMALEAYDRHPDERYRPTVYGISLNVDEVQYYSIQFDSYRFEEGRLVELERDYALLRKDNHDFHRLFTDQRTDTLSFVRSTSTGIINLTPGYHPFSIRVWDHANNVALLHGTIAHTPETRMAAKATPSDERDGWIVMMHSSVPLREYHAHFYNIRGQQVDQFSYRVPEPKDRELKFFIPRKRGYRRIIQIIGVDHWGARLEPVHVSLIPIDDVTRRRRFHVLTEHFDRGVVFQVSSEFYLPKAPEIFVRTSDNIQRYQTKMISPVDFISPVLIPSQVNGVKELLIRVNLSPVYEVRLPITSTIAVPGSKGRLVSHDGNFAVYYRPDSFYDSTYIWLANSNVSAPDGAYFVSHPVEIGPFTRPYRGHIYIQFTVPSNQLLPENAGVFYLDREEGWTFMPSVGPSSPEDLIRSRSYTSIANSGEIVALLEEHDPPNIKLRTPGQGATYTRSDLRKIAFTVEDDVAGIKDETAIQLMLDGLSRIFEYNTHRRTVTYTLPGPLESGEHKLVISATDQIGNARTDSVTFFIR
jgi:hypothetical protein